MVVEGADGVGKDVGSIYAAAWSYAAEEEECQNGERIEKEGKKGYSLTCSLVV